MSRRLFLGLVALCSACGFAGSLAAKPKAKIVADPARFAIIDTSSNTKSYLDVLHKAGVKVIGRYFSRCPQPDIVPQKRIIDNEGEVESILSHEAHFGILSIYQYYNNHEKKFEGMYFDKKKKKFFALPDSTCNEPANPPNTAEREAELDAAAAIKQAQAIGQPKGSAIYFGVDYNFEDTGKEKVLRYFTVVSGALRSHGFLVGVYGNGAAISSLKAEKFKDGPFKGRTLVDFAWLANARAPAASVELFNSGEWDIVQTKWDTRLPAGPLGSIEIDTNMQNQNRPPKYIGFWNKRGLYMAPIERTSAINDQGRAACEGAALIRVSPSKTAKAPSGSACDRKNVARE